MSNETESLLLKAVLEQYAVPDPKIVGTIQRSGIALSYVNHAEITRILIEIDPMWSWEPCAWDNGRPVIHEENGTKTMWGKLTVLNKTMLGVGSVRADKPDYEKELIGDFLRNAAMRFGISLSLWSKQDWNNPFSNITDLPIRRKEEIDQSRSNHPTNQQSNKIAVAEALQVRIKDDSPIPDYPTFDGETTESRLANVRPIKTQATVTQKQKGLIAILGKEVIKGEINPIIQEKYAKDSVEELTTSEASSLIKYLMEQKNK